MILLALWITSLPLAVFLALALAGRRRNPRLRWTGLAVAALGLVGDARSLALQRDVGTWRPHEAEVVVSERGRGSNDWRFAYEYEVEGRRHRGSVYTLRPRLRSRADTDHLYETHPVGQHLTVYVDPHDPDRAVVDPRPRYALPLAGFVMHGALLAAVVRRERAPGAQERRASSR